MKTCTRRNGFKVYVFKVNVFAYFLISPSTQLALAFLSIPKVKMESFKNAL